MPRHTRITDMQPSFGIAKQAAETLISRQRIAAIFNKAHHIIEITPRQRGIGRGANHLGVEFIRVKRRVAGHGQHMLRQHIKPAGAWRVAIQFACRGGFHGGDAFNHLKPIGGHQHGARRFIHAVIGAAHALQQPRDTFGRADLDDLIHIPPINAEIERGGGDHRAQLTRRHGRFHLAALVNLQAAMVECDRQRCLIQAP